MTLTSMILHRVMRIQCSSKDLLPNYHINSDWESMHRNDKLAYEYDIIYPRSFIVASLLTHSFLDAGSNSRHGRTFRSNHFLMFFICYRFVHVVMFFTLLIFLLIAYNRQAETRTRQRQPASHDHIALNISLKFSNELVQLSQNLHSDHELVNRPLDSIQLARELLVFVCGDARSDDRARDTTCSAEGSLRSNEDIGNVLAAI